GNGIGVTRTAGTVVLSLASQTVTSTGGNGINIAGGAAASTTITTFSAITIGGTTGGIGVNISDAKFDATAGGAYNQVNGGALTIGTSGAGNGAGSSGFVLLNPLGDLSFTTMNVFADNGTALKISGAAAV